MWRIQHVLQRQCVCIGFVLSMLVLTACGGVPSVGSASGTTINTPTASAAPTPVGSSGTLSSNATTPGSVAQEIKVFGDESAFPATCTPRAVAQTLMQLFDAVEAGDEQQLQQLVSPRFEWYREIVDANPNSSRNFTLNTSSEVVEYLARRHEQEERMELRDVRVYAYEPQENIVQATLLVTREANDLDSRLGGDEHLGYGRTAIDCEGRTLKMWSVGGIFFDPNDSSRRFGAPCGSQAEIESPQVVRVCMGEDQ